MAKIDTSSNISCVLFDLDGTLLDTAPDMTHALNALLAEENKPPLSHEQCRHYASHGSIALVNLGFTEQQSPEDFERRRRRFLEIYEQNLCLDTKLFDGMAEVLNWLEQNQLSWGIVTNKPAYLTEPLLKQLELFERACSVVSGDTLAVNKPSPEPLYLAATQCQHLATECLYVGDAERDIVAGKRANMRTLIAKYGYIEPHEPIASWGADGVINHPDEILSWVD